MFVVASTMGLSIQQREREIALLRAVAATPGQIRRMIAWEAAIVALIGSAAGIWPGAVLGNALGHALVRHGIAPDNFVVTADWMPAAGAVLAGVRRRLCSPSWEPHAAPPACRRRSRSETPPSSRGCWGRDV